MITVNSVSMHYGGRTLFDRVDVTFNAGERYGLTGPNGAGKSTFMRILAGDLEPTSGTVQRPRRVGVLRQDHYGHDSDRVIDAVIMGNPPLWNALEEKARLLAKPDLTDQEGMRLGELEGVIAEEDGYAAESEAALLLEGLGIPEALHERRLGTLQGNDKVKVLLAQALFGKPDALLLDEPTNSLDIANIRWLEGFLSDYSGVLVVISHDRHFLNEVCTRIADIDYETIIIYPGDYDQMVEAKAEARTSLELQNAARQKRVAALQEFVQRFRAGSRASQVKSRERAIEREKKLLADLKRSNIARPFIRFDQKRPSGKQALTVERLNKRWGDQVVLRDFNLSVPRGERVAVVGPNGAGKTTLLKLLAGVLEPDSGTIEWGYEAAVGYMPQDHAELIGKSPNQTAHEWLWQFAKNIDEEQIRSLFGRLLFTKEEPFKPLSVLSGGETVRMLLARLMLLGPNVLLLDEPTNHLDLESIRSLIQGLISYQGTVLFVTHDRNMVSQVATRVLELVPGGVVRELSLAQFDAGEFLSDAVQYQRAAARG